MKEMQIQFAPMTMLDVPDSLILWKKTEGICLREADSPQALTQFLERNPGHSFVARDGSILAGVALAGHDGRRGCLYHVAVAAHYRRCGIGTKLVANCLTSLENSGIRKCHLLVLKENVTGREFWAKLGWHFRPELDLMSFTCSGAENA